jgi:glycine oxidase
VRVRADEVVVDLLVDARDGERAGAGARVIGARTERDVLRAEAVVLAAGAWSDALAKTAGLSLPTTPVKGQMVRLTAVDGLVRHVVKRGSAYAVPRAGQGIVVGTTSEQAGFDRSLDEVVLDGLVRETARLVPALSDLVRAEAWSGFRPRLADGLPAVGRVAARPGLFLATGHYRNGVLLCAATGRGVADAVLGRADAPTGETLRACSPDRPSLRPEAPA